jgi:glycosyltransferase involved in cell wall biosynthesis
MRVLAWVPEAYDSSPGQRYRIEQWEPLLRDHDISIEYAPFADRHLVALLKKPGRVLSKSVALLRALARRSKDVGRARSFDLVYIFREAALIGPALPERALARTGIPTVFDFDDAVWIRYVSPANGRFSYLRFPGKAAFSCKSAAHVIVGNEYLAEYATRYTAAVTIVPSTIDTARYLRVTAGRPSRPPTIGWTGSYSSGRYLDLVRSALQTIGRRHKFRFVVIGPVHFEVPGVAIDHRPWSPTSEVEDLSDFDIGIMPVPDAPWERGKCGLKALQYMALGIPPVVSPVGANRDIVRDGTTGLWASDEAGWVSALERLLGNPSERARLGDAARRTVESLYSASSQAPRVAALLRAAAATRQP